MSSTSTQNSHTGAFAEAFFIANLLFVGVFYLALWVLYLLRYQSASAVDKQHLHQTLLASSISTAIFIVLNLNIMLTDGYASLMALFSLEVYFMLIVPLFLIAGIIGFTKAIKSLAYTYPLLSWFAK